MTPTFAALQALLADWERMSGPEVVVRMPEMRRRTVKALRVAEGLWVINRALMHLLGEDLVKELLGDYAEAIGEGEEDDDEDRTDD